MKTVKKIEQYLLDGSTYLSLLLEGEKNGRKAEYLSVSIFDDDIFTLAILSEPDHQIDYKFDDKYEKLCWFSNISLGLEAGSYSDKEVDDEGNEFYDIPPKVLAVKSYLSGGIFSLSILVQTADSKKDYIVVDALSDAKIFPIAVFTQPGHLINCRFDGVNMIWFKNFTLDLQVDMKEVIPQPNQNTPSVESLHWVKNKDWFGIAIVALAIGCIIAGAIILFG